MNREDFVEACRTGDTAQLTRFMQASGHDRALLAQHRLHWADAQMARVTNRWGWFRACSTFSFKGGKYGGTDMEEVPIGRSILREKAILWGMTGLGTTGLHAASEADHPGVVQMLLKNSADPLCRDSCGNVPLHLAATHGHVKVVRQLLCLPRAIIATQLHSKNARGQTPLHCCLYRMQRLLKRGATTYCNWVAQIGATKYGMEWERRIFSLNTVVDMILLFLTPTDLDSKLILDESHVHGPEPGPGSVFGSSIMVLVTVRITGEMAAQFEDSDEAKSRHCKQCVRRAIAQATSTPIIYIQVRSVAVVEAGTGGNRGQSSATGARKRGRGTKERAVQLTCSILPRPLQVELAARKLANLERKLGCCCACLAHREVLPAAAVALHIADKVRYAILPDSSSGYSNSNSNLKSEPPGLPCSTPKTAFGVQQSDVVPRIPEKILRNKQVVGLSKNKRISIDSRILVRVDSKAMGYVRRMALQLSDADEDMSDESHPYTKAKQPSKKNTRKGRKAGYLTGGGASGSGSGSGNGNKKGLVQQQYRNGRLGFCTI